MNLSVVCKCGSPDTRKIDLCLRDEHVAYFWACEPCLDETYGGALRVRVEFEKLLGDGFDRETANEMMIRRIDLGEFR